MKTTRYITLWKFVACVCIFGFSSVSFWRWWSDDSGGPSVGSSRWRSAQAEVHGWGPSSATATSGNSNGGPSRTENTSSNTSVSAGSRNSSGINDSGNHANEDRSITNANTWVLDHAGVENRTSSGVITERNNDRQTRNGNRILRTQDISAFESTINGVPASQRLPLLERALARIEARKASIQNSSTGLTASNVRSITVLSEIQDLIQGHINVITSGGATTAIPVSAPQWSAISNLVTTTGTFPSTSDAIAITGLVTMKTSTDSFVLNSGNKDYTVLTNVFSSGGAQVINQFGSKIPVNLMQSFIQLNVTNVTVIGTLDGSTIHATTVIIKTKEGAR